MRSLYFSIALTLLGALSLSLLVFAAISDRIEKKYINPVFEVMDQLELESAQSAWDKDGSAAVASYMDHLNHMFGPSHYFLNSKGVDVISGKSQAAFLPNPPATLSRGFVQRRFIVTHRSADGRYWLLKVGPQQPDRWEFSPYYFLVIGVTSVLCWLAAVFVVLPIRNVTATVERFGQGDLSARTKLKRRDEIGGLARSFNEMAERLERLLVSERRLLEDISHELRSPLARMKLAVKLARTSPDPSAALDRVEREVDRIATLTSEIVEVTRLEGDPRLLKLDSVNLRELVQEAASDCCGEVEPRVCNIRVDAQFSGQVFCDRELLRRAVENLLRNAIRYSPEHAPIDVLLAQNIRNVTITVRDYGLGVPDRSLVQIFEPFFRVDEAREMDSGGVGLGLSIVKRVVDLHHGTVAAHNAYPGLRVEIALPR
jgi:signal transduction histidine kinase